MKCINCGYENNENARFCQGCGEALVFEQNPLTERMQRLLKDNLFMVLCILYSISIGFSLNSGSVNILGILMTIFLWLLFAQSRKGTIDSHYMRCISGTIYASYVIKLVLFCIAAFCGLLSIIASFLMDVDHLWDLIYPEIESFIADYLGVFDFITNFALRLYLAVIIIIAIAGIFLNVLGRRSIHRFAQSIYKNLEYGQMDLVKCGTAQSWLMVFGILNAIFAVFNTDSFFSEGCLSAAFIMGSILVKKYFGDLK